MLSQEILEQLEECKDAKEVQALAKANGYELTDEQAKEAYEAINGERELTEAELAQVAGGKTEVTLCVNQVGDECGRVSRCDSLSGIRM